MRRLPCELKNYKNLISLIDDISNSIDVPGIKITFRTKQKSISRGYLAGGECNIKKSTLSVWVHGQNEKTRSEKELMFILLHEYCHLLHMALKKHEQYYTYCTDRKVKITLISLFDGYLAESDCNRYAKETMLHRFQIKYDCGDYKMCHVSGFGEFIRTYNKK